MNTNPYLDDQISRVIEIDPIPRMQDHLARFIGGTVGLHEILEEIDREISQLQQARALLEAPASASPKIPKKRNLTPEGRRRIAEAVRRRWELEKKNKLMRAAAGWVIESQPTSNLAYQSSPI